MSLIHLEKSVLTFHIKEILEDGHGSHPLTWLGLGLLILGPKLIPAKISTKVETSQPKNAKPLRAKRSGHTSISLSQWIAEAQQRELTQQVNTTIAHHQESEKILMN